MAKGVEGDILGESYVVRAVDDVTALVRLPNEILGEYAAIYVLAHVYRKTGREAYRKKGKICNMSGGYDA